MNAEEPLKIPTAAELNGWLNALFTPVGGGDGIAGYTAAMEGFENLTGYFAFQVICGGESKNSELFEKFTERIHIDYVGLTAMLKRFQRDAYGVKRFCDLTDALVADGKLDPAVRVVVVGEVRRLGLRITADKPRKTRVAAAFALWMCTFRPVSIDAYWLVGVEPTELEVFCASLNFWLAETFLCKFGRVEVGSGEDERILLERIKHDFTFRQVSLSTMETLFSSIFRAGNGVPA